MKNLFLIMLLLCTFTCVAQVTNADYNLTIKMNNEVTYKNFKIIKNDTRAVTIRHEKTKKVLLKKEIESIVLESGDSVEEYDAATFAWDRFKNYQRVQPEREEFLRQESVSNKKSIELTGWQMMSKGQNEVVTGKLLSVLGGILSAGGAILTTQEKPGAGIALMALGSGSSIVGFAMTIGGSKRTANGAKQQEQTYRKMLNY